MADNNFALTVQPPTTFAYLGQSAAGGYATGGVLIGDYVNNTTTTPAGSAYNIPTPTLVSTVPVSAQLELQSTTGALLIMRMTTTQRNALITVVNGMVIYNSTTTTFQFYQNGGWVSLSAGAGGVVGPGGGSTDKAVARWNGAGGATLQDSVLIVGDTGAVTGMLTIAGDAATAGAPTYTFTGDVDTGIYHSGANTIDFATNGLRQVSIGTVATTVNYLQFIGSATGTSVKINALGTDSNVDVEIVPKGTGAVVHPVGAVATPSVTFTGDTDTGMWHSAANTIDFSTNAQRVMQLVTTPASTVNYLTVTASATGTPVIIATTGTDSAVNLQLFPKGTTTGQVVHPVGAVATPSMTFLGDLVTGLWHSAANTIDFSGNSVRQFQVSSTATAVDFISVTGSATNAANSALQPSLVASGSDTVVDVAVVGKGSASGLAVLANSAAQAGSIKLWNGGNTFYTLLQSANVAANKTFTLPLADASANADATTVATPLSSNGSGVLSFSDTGLKYVNGTLTLGQVLAAYTTPVELIPAPGANLMVVINNFVIEYIYGSAAYANGGAVYLEYGSTAHGTNYATSVTGIPAAVLTGLAASTAIAAAGTINTTTGLATSVAANAAINYTNATANFITGTGGSARYAIWYSIVPIT